MTIRPLTDRGDPGIAAVVKIYVDALPACERKPIAWLRSLPDRPDYLLVVAEADDVVLGFAVLFVPPDLDDAALLEYMAVAAASRGGGVGGRLLAAVRAVGRPVLTEIKSDDADADRRRAFYHRGGCREVIGLSYQCPLPDAPPMRLMVGGADAVSRPTLARWLTTIYSDVYGQPLDDPRLGAMIAALPDPVVLQ